MDSRKEKFVNFFGYIRFILVLTALITIWIIVAYVFISFQFSSYETCMILVMPIFGSIMIPFALFAIAIAHPMSIEIDKESLELNFMIGKMEEIKFSDVEEIKMNYKSKLSFYPIYIKIKNEEKPKSIDGIGKNIQEAVVKYGKLNGISTERFSYLSSSPKND